MATYARDMLPMRVVIVLGLACSASCDSPKVSIDAGPPVIIVPPSCPPLPEASTFNFFGEACTAAPFPANTVCHANDAGWCIEGVCRPQSSSGHCPICPAGTEHFAPAGAGYCAR